MTRIVTSTIVHTILSTDKYLLSIGLKLTASAAGKSCGNSCLFSNSISCKCVGQRSQKYSFGRRGSYSVSNQSDRLMYDLLRIYPIVAFLIDAFTIPDQQYLRRLMVYME